MKQTIVFYFITFFLFLLGNCMCQWQSDVRLTNDPASSYLSQSRRCIVANENFVHVVWFDYRINSNQEIYYKCSIDSGINWGVDTRLTNSPGLSVSPSLSISGLDLHIVWEDIRDGNQEIYYKRSTDGGINWGADVRLTNNNNYSGSATISVLGQMVHVLWTDSRDGNYNIYYKRSSDTGVTWSIDNRITNTNFNSVTPSVSVSGSILHVAWRDNRDGNYEVYYKHSIDGGLNWGTDTRLSYDTANVYSPFLSVSGLFVFVVWNDNRIGNQEIYYRRSSDGGTSWEPEMRLTYDTANSYYPSLSISGQIVDVVWYDQRVGNYEIYYKRSNDAGLNWGNDIRLTNDPANSILPSISVFGQAIHVIWYDYRDGNSEIYYKRNPTGNIVSINNASPEIQEVFSLSQNYPNPFNPITKIKFYIPSNTEQQLTMIKIIIYDVLGNIVKTLVNEHLKPNIYEVEWDATNNSSGIYYYQLTTFDFTDTKKMILIK